MSNKIKVRVQDEYTTTREGEKNGKAWKIVQQENVFFEMGGEIRKVPVSLDNNVKPFAVGMYSLDPISLLRFGRYGLEVDGFKPLQLVPVTAGIAGLNKVA